MTDHILQLPDQRKLAYAIYGPKNGQPVFYFNGTPSSRLELLMLPAFGVDIEKLLSQYNINLIAVDRPGIGKSDYHPAATFFSFANDIAVLAQALQIASAKSLSWSGGGPYALSQAFHFPDFITGVYIFTGFTISFREPGAFRNMAANKYYFGAARYTPWLMKSVLRLNGSKPSKSPMPKWISRQPAADYNLLEGHPIRTEMFTKYSTVEAIKHTTDGVVHEAQLYFRATDYQLQHIRQPVHYWWGTDDNVVIAQHYKAIEQRVAKHHIHFKEGEGHISVYVKYMQEALEIISDS